MSGSVDMEQKHLEDVSADVKLAAPQNDNHGDPITHTPSNHPGEPLKTTANDSNDPEQAQKKKKKKKNKKPKAKDSQPSVPPPAANVDTERDRASVLCISRNKHWRYISSYHGPWLQLPLELLESLLVLNLDPATMAVPESRAPALPPPPLSANPHSYSHHISGPRLRDRDRDRDRGFHSIADYTPPDSPRSTFNPLPATYTSAITSAAPFPVPGPGKATPPPIDPGVFRNVTAIRRLIDEASELSVRASSGLSAAALGTMRAGGGGGAWAAAQALGLDGSGQNAGGRNVAMSAMRVHRLRALAVQKLALAYKADEIASSVMVMQGGSVFDDIAERVLKHDPNDVDARYVHFFHEKIPSRQLAESTTTQLLDELIVTQPQRLEFYRTRGIVHCFRDEYTQATRDFTHALKESRAARKARLAHRNITSGGDSRGKTHKKKKGHIKTNGQAPPSGTNTSAEGATIDGPDGEPLHLHPSVLPDAPDPIEPQLLFLRGSAYLQHAVSLIESAILKLEGISKTPAALDGAELRLCYLENGRYGGVEIGNPDGPLGRSDGVKPHAYRQALGEEGFREQICTLVKKGMRDHERFLAHFDTLEGPPPAATADTPPADLAQRVETAFLLTESVRPGTHSAAAGLVSVDSVVPAMFTTYHPLLVESHFSILICLLMLMDLPTLLPSFARTAALVDGLEGYPVFLPPRSMAQAEFIEILERLASGWKVGVQPHSLLTQAIGRLAIEAPPSSPHASIDAMSSSSQDSDSTRPSASTSACHDNSAQQSPGCATPTNDTRVDLVHSLDCMRMLLVPVAARQKERAEKAAAERAAGTNKKKPLNINIPLHGPRVEIVLAWLAAVHLFELEIVA